MRAVYLIAAALAILLVTALVLAPAQWAASYVHSASNGRIELAEASGTIWNGSAIVVIASPAETGASRASLPERLSWRLSPWELLAGQVDLALTHRYLSPVDHVGAAANLIDRHFGHES